MVKFVEMDKNVTINDQRRGKKQKWWYSNCNKKFDLTPDKIDPFLKDWTETSILFKQQSGFITTESYKGIRSSIFISYQV